MKSMDNVFSNLPCMNSIAKGVVAERFEGEKVVRKDMLGSFVAHGLTQDECRSEVVLQIIAGSDTTATAMRSTLLHLMSSPHSYYTLRTEIDKGIAEGLISIPIADIEGRKLPYLQAVIKEGLRIFPPVTGLMLKVVPKEGAILNGTFIPGGSEIGYCMLGIQHSKKIFGEDAALFRPERWLEADEEKLREMQNTVDLVFGHGKWLCAGKSVAVIELNKIFVEVSSTTKPNLRRNHRIF
jgi:cytochrome P450